ncbi:unnamed protein product [Somion occarium]|uniref:Yeast cell wall synthesis Kre9/Knh1-like N-terminal domain-containing protein n=1 Tax=Somion occarium TaxID=3059160 RepID=A0ABP1D2F4_9APHY
MFRLSAAVALLALAASSAAYSISRPEDGAIWDPSQPQIIAWSKVNTDPQTFAITLVHQASQPNTRQLLEDSVDGGQGSITVNPPSGGWPSGTAYQINFVQDSNHLDSILAQSQQFDIKLLELSHRWRVWLRRHGWSSPCVKRHFDRIYPVGSVCLGVVIFHCGPFVWLINGLHFP